MEQVRHILFDPPSRSWISLFQVRHYLVDHFARQSSFADDPFARALNARIPYGPLSWGEALAGAWRPRSP
jgi:hypothetical protein